METVTRMVTFAPIICLLICSSVALPSKQVANASDENFQPTQAATSQREELVPKTTRLHKMGILKVPTNTRLVRLFNKNGYFLKISNAGRLRGTRSIKNPNTLIVMESMGPSIVRLKGVVSKTYLCMNDEGVCHIMAQPTDECLFKEKLGTNYFNTYASYKYSGRNPGNITQEFYIAIKKNGKLKHGANTAMIQKSVDFTVVPLKKGRSHG